MAKGKAKVNYLGRAGLVASQDQPDYNFLYTPATSVKDAKWNIGDRVVLPDGRVFRYARTYSTCKTGRLAHFDQALAISNTVLAADRAVGDKYITVGTQTFAVDQLRGGYVAVKRASGLYEQRGIVGNTVCSDSTVTIYLDAPLNNIVTTSMYVDVLPNPYYSVVTENESSGNSMFRSAAGVPAVEASAGGKYLWIQTWGPCHVDGGEALLGASNYYQRTFVCDTTNGALHELGDPLFGVNTGADNLLGANIVGFALDRTVLSTTACRFVMLQISP